MLKPLWITVEGLFEGHRGQWSDVFFTANSISDILTALTDPNGMFTGCRWEIRPMTDEEYEQYPDAEFL